MGETWKQPSVSKQHGVLTPKRTHCQKEHKGRAGTQRFPCPSLACGSSWFLWAASAQAQAQARHGSRRKPVSSSCSEKARFQQQRVGRTQGLESGNKPQCEWSSGNRPHGTNRGLVQGSVFVCGAPRGEGHRARRQHLSHALYLPLKTLVE